MVREVKGEGGSSVYLPFSQCLWYNWCICSLSTSVYSQFTEPLTIRPNWLIKLNDYFVFLALSTAGISFPRLKLSDVVVVLLDALVARSFSPSKCLFRNVFPIGPFLLALLFEWPILPYYTKRSSIHIHLNGVDKINKLICMQLCIIGLIETWMTCKSFEFLKLNIGQFLNSFQSRFIEYKSLTEWMKASLSDLFTVHLLYSNWLDFLHSFFFLKKLNQ